MPDKTYELSRRKALLGLGTIGAAGAAAGMGTSALFSDEETFEENSITAGTSNLKVTLGLESIDSSAPGALDINYDVDEDMTADGTVGTSVTIGDMKPGDCVTLRATVDIVGNPMYVAAEALNLSDAENGESDPESSNSPPDNSSSPDAISGGFGDLDNRIDVRFGQDTDRTSLHDNTLEGSIDDDEFTGTLTDFLANYLGTGVLYRGRNDDQADPAGGHGPAGASATRIGDDTTAGNVDRDKVTHFIELCLPEDVGNEVQGDSVSFDLRWASEQVRNNSVSQASDIL